MFEITSAAISQSLVGAASQDDPEAMYSLPCEDNAGKASVKHLTLQAEDWI